MTCPLWGWRQRVAVTPVCSAEMACTVPQQTHFFIIFILFDLSLVDLKALCLQRKPLKVIDDYIKLQASLCQKSSTDALSPLFCLTSYWSLLMMYSFFPLNMSTCTATLSLFTESGQLSTSFRHTLLSALIHELWNAYHVEVGKGHWSNESMHALIIAFQSVTDIHRVLSDQ